MVSVVRRGPVVGLVVQAGLLAGLAMFAGLGALGWLAGFGYGLVTCLALARAMRRHGTNELGLADRVTLARATLVGGVAALTFVWPTPVAALLTLAIAALVLDAVDGQVARRTGTATALGARFDMEVDASLLLVLSGYVAHLLGAWVLAIGLMRYAYVMATWVLPWLRRPLPPRYWRKVVAATQGIVLVFAAADVLPRLLVTAALVVALALLCESFGRDALWLWVRRYEGVSRRPGEAYRCR